MRSGGLFIFLDKANFEIDREINNYSISRNYKGSNEKRLSESNERLYKLFQEKALFQDLIYKQESEFYESEIEDEA